MSTITLFIWVAIMLIFMRRGAFIIDEYLRFRNIIKNAEYNRDFEIVKAKVVDHKKRYSRGTYYIPIYEYTYDGAQHQYVSKYRFYDLQDQKKYCPVGSVNTLCINKHTGKITERLEKDSLIGAIILIVTFACLSCVLLYIMG